MEISPCYCIASSNLQPHMDVLPVSKGLNKQHIVLIWLHSMSSGLCTRSFFCVSTEYSAVLPYPHKTIYRYFINKSKQKLHNEQMSTISNDIVSNISWYHSNVSPNIWLVECILTLRQIKNFSHYEKSLISRKDAVLAGIGYPFYTLVYIWRQCETVTLGTTILKISTDNVSHFHNNN